MWNMICNIYIYRRLEVDRILTNSMKINEKKGGKVANPMKINNSITDNCSTKSPNKLQMSFCLSFKNPKAILQNLKKKSTSENFYP